MPLLDQIARGATIVLLALMAVAFLREWRRLPAAGSAAAFFVTVAAHLVLTAPDYTAVLGLDAVLMAGAFAVPVTFWLFSRALFDEDRRLDWRDGAAVIVLISTGFLRGSRWSSVATALFYATSLAVVGVALGRVARGLPSDLVEPRRRLRAVLTVTVGVTILAVIAGEVVLAGDRAPWWLDAVKSAGALGLTLLFANWLLALRPDLLVVDSIARSTATRDTSTASAEDARFRDRLLALMRDERVYRQEGLTIAGVARTLDLPEYRLRRVINQQLGYRNFNAFLNDFRIEDACRVLADPSQERTPILNLALDLGFGSPGPFNRAFRAKTGQTPTDYRRSHLGS